MWRFRQDFILSTRIGIGVDRSRQKAVVKARPRWINSYCGDCSSEIVTMGWFLPSHMDSGFIFGLLGLWHMFSILHSYISNPRGFRSKAWYPTRFAGYFRSLELWILLFIVTAFMIKQLSHATVDIAAGVIHTEHLIRFQHVAFSLMYFVYITVALMNANSRFLPLPEGTLHATFALGFLSELIVFHFGHHPGDNLESYVHMLMQLIIVVVVLLMFLEISHPSSVVLSLGRAMCVTFKGVWFFYIGVLINIPSSIPLGCSIPEGEDFPYCKEPMDNMRAKAIQVLIFIVQAVTILVLTFAMYGTVRFLVGQTPENADYDEVSAEMEDNAQVYFVVDKDGDLKDEIDKNGVPILKTLPKSLSRRMSKRSSAGSTPNPVVVGKTPRFIVESSSPTSLGLLGSPLPKNIKNV